MIHDAVIAEFGGSLVVRSVEAEAVRDDIELGEFQSQPQNAERMPGPSVSLVCM